MMLRSGLILSVPLVLALACGDDGPPTSGGSGDGSSGGMGSSTTGIGGTSLATTGGSTGTSSSSGEDDADSSSSATTGEQAQPCDVCADADLCVLEYHEKVCILCDALENPPFDVVCVPEIPAACGDDPSYSRACALALCGTPYIDSVGCGCSGDGEYICGVTMQGFHTCDYWDAEALCNPGSKCVPARDDDYQPLPYTECNPPPDTATPLGDPCTAGLVEDPCEPMAYCDEVDGTMMGVCRSLCTGTVDVPTCPDPGDACVLFFEGQPEFGGVCRPA